MSNKLHKVTIKGSKEPVNKDFLHGEGKPIAIKAGLVVVLLLFLFFVYRGDNARPIDLAELKATITTDCDMTHMKAQNERELKKFIGLNASDYGNSFIYFKSDESLGVEELLILETKNKDKLSAAKDACEARIDSQIQAFSGYGPEQVALLENAILLTKGDYLFYSVGDVSDEYEEVFLNAVQ